MGFHSGRDGSLYVDGTRLARVSNWSLSSSVEALEVTDLGANERSYVPGLKAATGTASVFYHDDAPVALISKVITTNALRENDQVKLSLRWGTKKIDVDVYVTQAEIACQVGSVMQANISFTVNGNYLDLEL